MFLNVIESTLSQVERRFVQKDQATLSNRYSMIRRADSHRGVSTNVKRFDHHGIDEKGYIAFWDAVKNRYII